MKYARAAWRIFLACAARTLHLPQHVVTELEDQATFAMFACSRDFEPATVITPVGYRCSHVQITSIPGVVAAPTAWCGCQMTPVFA